MRKSSQRLEDIYRAILDIRDFVQDMEQQTFLKSPTDDRKTFKAVAACLQEVGEAVKSLPDEIIDRHEDVPWRLIAGMRDHIAHEYFRIDAAVVWATIESGEFEALFSVVKEELECGK
ncbi:MAG: HepT-like ribonuclease domain-containing protein [Hyphomicrobiales bacterium]